jgi:hypothetical protein
MLYFYQRNLCSRNKFWDLGALKYGDFKFELLILFKVLSFVTKVK